MGKVTLFFIMGLGLALVAPAAILFALLWAYDTLRRAPDVRA